MTCIVGLATGGHVIIGGDAAGVQGHDLRVRADGKVFQLGEFAMGFTTSFRMGQLLRYALDPPAPDTWDLDRFMATTFVDAVRACLTAGGWMGKDQGRDDGGDFLVGVRGQLYRVASDFQIGRTSIGYDAVGSGSSYATGSLHTSHRLVGDPRTRVRLALEAARDNSASVAGPFTFAVAGPT